MHIYVGNLSFSMTTSQLKDIFKKYGEVIDVRIITDRISRRSKGFGFVEMADDEEAKTAIKELNGTEQLGRTLQINEARPRPPREERRQE